jgi:hypothetical protein
MCMCMHKKQCECMYICESKKQTYARALVGFVSRDSRTNLRRLMDARLHTATSSGEVYSMICVCVWVSECVWKWMYMCVYLSECMCVCVSECICKWMYMCVSASECTCVYMLMNVYVCKWIYVYVNECICKCSSGSTCCCSDFCITCKAYRSRSAS